MNGRCHENSFPPHFSNLKYRIKILLVHGSADVEQNELLYSIIIGIRYFSVNGIPIDVTSKPRYRTIGIKYRISDRFGFSGIPISE